jgi:hypothetical protein
LKKQAPGQASNHECLMRTRLEESKRLTMDVLFPFGFPGPTAFYLTFYVLTLVLHIVPMNYVLAGSTYWAVSSLFARPEDAATGRNLLSHLLRDWMPFALGVAITAGVAPLLFVQILYKVQFYSANLLLFHRWMVIVPTLILAFYLLYIRKVKVVDHWPLPTRILLAVATCSCFVFVAWSWTENHLLSLDSRVWPEQYASGRLVYRNWEQLPRLAVWFLGAFPTLAAVLGWQVLYYQRHENDHKCAPVKRLARLAVLTILATGMAGAVYYFWVDDQTRQLIWQPAGLPYFIVAVCGWMAQLAVWFRIFYRGRFASLDLAVATVATLAAVVGMTVIRELRRIAAVNLPDLYAEHAAAAAVGGLTLFLCFFVLNGIVMARAVLMVRRNVSAGPTNYAKR